MSKIIKAHQQRFPEFVKEIITQRDLGNFFDFTKSTHNPFYTFKDRIWKTFSDFNYETASIDVAVVDANGDILALANQGQTTISAKDKASGAVVASFTLYVNPKP